MAVETLTAHAQHPPVFHYYYYLMCYAKINVIIMNRCDYDNYLRGCYKTYQECMLVCLHKQPSLQLLLKHLIIQTKWFTMNLPIQLLCLSWHVLWTLFIIWNLRGIVNRPRRTIYRFLSELDRLGTPNYYNTIEISALSHYLQSSLSSLCNA